MTLNEFVTKIKSDVKSIEHIYKGLVITELSLPNYEKNINKIYYNSFYFDASNTNQSVKLLIPLVVLNKAKKDGHTINENVSVDVTIDSISLDKKSTMLIKISSIIESGVSEQELFVRNLTKYCNEKKIFERIKKPLPSLLKRIAIISTYNTNTKKDIIANLAFAKDTHSFKVHNTSEAIAKQINLCQKDNYDLILLYRGGHEDKSMNIYSDIPVLNAIVESNTHIGVALGHEVDVPFVYKIADSTYSTPSTFAQKTDIYNISKLNQFDSIFAKFENYFKNNLFINKLDASISIINERIDNSTKNVMRDKSDTLVGLQNNISHKTNIFFNNTEMKLNSIYKNINYNALSIENNIKSKLTLVNNRNTNSINKILDSNKISESIHTNINTSAALLVEKLNKDLIYTNGNINTLVSKLELNIQSKKNKTTKNILIIALIVVVLIVAIFNMNK